MKVAVVMAAYNAASFIGDALSSLLRQSGDVNLDIIVGNDGSTDGTVEAVRALGAPNIRVLDLPHRGVAATRNAILSAIAPDTDFVTYLDSDDLSPKGRLKRALGYFQDDPSLDLVYGDSLMFRTIGADPLEPDPNAPTLRLRSVQLGAGLYRYELVGRVGAYDEAFVQAEDFDFLLRMLELGPRIRVTGEIEYFYRRHETNMTYDYKTLTRYIKRAMLNAAKRKSSGTLAPVPPGFFDVRSIIGNLDW